MKDGTMKACNREISCLSSLFRQKTSYKIWAIDESKVCHFYRG